MILEVGVGANDREAFQLIHGHLPKVDALADVVASVTGFRTVEAIQHPLNRMAPERFLRWQVQQQPEHPRPRRPRAGRSTRAATEHEASRTMCRLVVSTTPGHSSPVVFSSGVDLDLTPFVADVALTLPDDVERVLVATPERDLVAATRDLAALLDRPVELIGL